MNILAKGNSMFPTLKDGELYNLVLLENDNAAIGDIIVYCVNDITICHRIISVIKSKDSTLFFVTKGDNCAESDPYAVTLDNIDHVTNHTDIYKNVYRNSLCCGCGSEYLVISQTGEIRPCQMLPESWFSLKNENTFIEHINGNFHIEQLQESIRKYYIDNNYETLKISPCQALENFVNLEKMNYV